MKCGGTSSSNPADSDLQQVINLIKPEVEERLGRQLSMFKAMRVARQLVQGVNFFVKVDIGEADYIHVRVYQNLPCYGSKTELHGIQTGKSANDEVSYFEGFHI